MKLVVFADYGLDDACATVYVLENRERYEDVYIVPVGGNVEAARALTNAKKLLAAAKADGFVFGTPVYYAHPTGRILSLMDRMFYAGKKSFFQKPAAVIASARRGGTTASLDAISKHLTISQMPVISSTYWNMVHGSSPDETVKDEEGMQTMRNLARNMAWILKCIEAGRVAGINAPPPERGARTNFIR